MAEKKSYETVAHGQGDYVPKDDALILFRGALDHAEAEIILTQAVLKQEILFARSIDPELESYLKRLQGDLQELVDVLRAVMTSEYTGKPIEGIAADGSGGTFRLFGLTLDELQKRSHNAQEYYGVPTMTRPDYRYGEVYARLNLIRTELRQVETAAVRLFREQGARESASVATAPVSSGLSRTCSGSVTAGIGSPAAPVAAELTSPAIEPARPDLLYLLNRLSSAAHALMCRHLSQGNALQNNSIVEPGTNATSASPGTEVSSAKEK